MKDSIIFCQKLLSSEQFYVLHKVCEKSIIRFYDFNFYERRNFSLRKGFKFGFVLKSLKK